jgi:hypothetical protein
LEQFFELLMRLKYKRFTTNDARISKITGAVAKSVDASD